MDGQVLLPEGGEGASRLEVGATYPLLRSALPQRKNELAKIEQTSKKKKCDKSEI